MSWTEIEFLKCLQKVKIGRDNQVNTSNFETTGKYPIIDQGQDYIAGYSNDAGKLFSDFPVIIFGDHTRCFKYVNFPFIVGADGTKILKPDPNMFDAKFFYFQCISLNLPSRGYNRHFKLLKEKRVLCPSLPEQKAIAHILSQIQSAIEAQEKIIQTTTELKKTLMNELFTESINENNSVKFGSVATLKNGINFERNKKGQKGILTIDVLNMYGDNIYVKLNSLYRVDKEIPPSSDYILNKGDILFVRSSLKPEGVGWCTMFDGFNELVTYCGFLIKAKLTTKEFIPEFLTYYFRSDIGRKYFFGASRVSITNVNQGTINEIPIPVISIDKQQNIIDTLNKAQEKINNHILMQDKLTQLFQTTLHELMTGQVDVKNLDFGQAETRI